MTSKITLPFGTWPSSISADMVASAAPKINHIQSNGTLLTWVESRPDEGGRNVIMGRNPDGLINDLIPPPYSHHSRVHEYGGMAYHCLKVASTLSMHRINVFISKKLVKKPLPPLLKLDHALPT